MEQVSMDESYTKLNIEENDGSQFCNNYIKIPRCAIFKNIF